MLNKLITQNDNLVNQNNKYLNDVKNLHEENNSITSEALSLSKDIQRLLSVMNRRGVHVKTLNHYVETLNSNMTITMNDNDALKYRITSLNKLFHRIPNLENNVFYIAECRDASTTRDSSLVDTQKNSQ